MDGGRAKHGEGRFRSMHAASSESLGPAARPRLPLLARGGAALCLQEEQLPEAVAHKDHRHELFADDRCRRRAAEQRGGLNAKALLREIDGEQGREAGRVGRRSTVPCVLHVAESLRPRRHRHALEAGGAGRGAANARDDVVRGLARVP